MIANNYSLTNFNILNYYTIMFNVYLCIRF